MRWSSRGHVLTAGVLAVTLGGAPMTIEGTSLSPRHIEHVFVDGPTVSLHMSDGARMTLQTATGRILENEPVRARPLEVAVPLCRWDGRRKTLCPFPEGVLTLTPQREGTVLEWHAAGGGWRALKRSGEPEAIWSAGGKLFLDGARFQTATLECLDRRRGTALWLYAYSVFGGSAVSIDSDPLGTVPLSGETRSAARAPYRGVVVVDPRQ